MNNRNPLAILIFVFSFSLLAGCLESSNEPIRQPLAPASPSQTARLLDLSLSSGELTPAFDSTVTSYQALVGLEIASVAVTASMGPSDTGLSVNGQEVISGTASQDIALQIGENTIEVVVTAQDGVSTQTYVIALYRLNNDASLAALTVSPGELVPAFSADVLDYLVELGSELDSIVITPVSSDANAVVSIAGQEIEFGADSGQITLEFGSNPVQVMVTAEDAETIITYTVDVYRQNNDAQIKTLNIQGLPLNETFDPTVSSYTATADPTTSQLILPAPGLGGGATATVNGQPWTDTGMPVELSYGANTITVVVTSEDGSNTQTYILDIYRVSDQAGLTGMELVGANLNQAFDPAVENYAAEVPFGQDLLSIIATSQSDVASIQLNGQALVSGQASGPLPLLEGANVVAVTVVAENLITVRSYEVIVTRQSAPLYHTDVNYIWYAIGGLPLGNFWYLGDKKWERESWYDCEGFTETGRDESSIYLRDTAGTLDLVINLTEQTIVSDPDAEILEVMASGAQDRPESPVVCPSTSNDYSPVFTSASIVEVNSGRTMVVALEATDADWPKEDLSFSLTDNPDSDNGFFKVTNFLETARAACRAGPNNEGHPDDPNNDRYYFVQEGVNSLAECEAACNQLPWVGGLDSTCKGIEYRAQGADPNFPAPRCEIWKRPILDTVPQPGYSCYTRESETPSVLSFAAAPDFRIPRDANVDNHYQVEALVSDGPDGNSSTQAISVWVIPPGDYLGRTGTACRAGRQNEGHPQDPNNASFFSIVNDVDDLESCQALCDAYPLLGAPDLNCTGVEYRFEGADYADTQSRCELWHVPVVATIPQKEYSCHVRDLVRDDYGPDIEFYAGDYKNVDESGTSTMTLSVLSPTELRWTADDGNSWTVTRTADRNRLVVGADYPYARDGYEDPAVIWDAEEVAGILGPGGRIYRTDWVHAKYSHSQTIWQEYIDNHPGELVRIQEAARQIRELKWAIAENLNTAQAYRDYKSDLGVCGDHLCYGRTDEADRRIAGFKAYVTAEVVSIEVDEAVSWEPEFAGGENNDLELFYNLEFTKSWKPRADEIFHMLMVYDQELILESIWQDNGEKVTNINDGADRAFRPAGNATKTLEATENETLRYGGVMFEVDGVPPRPEECSPNDGLGDVGPDCWPTIPISYFYRDYGLYDEAWGPDTRTWAGNAANLSQSLDFTYFYLALADMEYEEPLTRTHTITFEWDEPIRLTYEITKRNEEQYLAYLDNNTLQCDEKPVKKLTRRSEVTPISAPGFLIRNETDHMYSVSLNQVGPLYYGEVPPGEIFRRDTAWGHFTIDAVVNLTGEQLYSDYDVAIPIVVFTAQTLQTLFTSGVPIASVESAIKGFVSSGLTKAGTKIATTAAARSAASALSKRAFGRALLRTGAKAAELAAENGHKVLILTVKGLDRSTQSNRPITSAFDDVLAGDLAAAVYPEENTGEFTTWNYSGDSVFSSGHVDMYHIVGGPRLPCLNADGNIEIRGTPLRILDNEECASDPECTVD